MRKPLIVAVLSAIVGAVVAAPIAVMASHQFKDVPDSNVFHEAIAWMADNDITVGCNPPTSDEFCPEDPVTREQMSAFLKRLAENQVVDAASVQGLDATQLQGQQGPKGDPGIPGATSVYVVVGSEPAASSIDSHWVHCDAGDPVAGGGAANLTCAGAIYPFEPTGDPGGQGRYGYYGEWNFDLAGGPGSGQMVLWASCLDLPPLR